MNAVTREVKIGQNLISVTRLIVQVNQNADFWDHNISHELNRFGIVLLCLFSSTCATAKRVPPKLVVPIVVDGIGYSADGDGKDSYVVASDEASGRTLWRVKVFHTRTKFWRGEE